MIKNIVFKLAALSSLLLFALQGCAKPNTARHSLSPVDVQAEVKTLTHIASNINPKVLTLALKAYNKARHQGMDAKQILTVIDYSLPDTKKRMWVFNLSANHLLYNTLVAHGRNSGDVYAKKFSNRPSSKESSLGVYLTKNSYYGKDGYALRLEGLSQGFNNNVYKRAVVMHGAWYVSNNFVNKYHRLGRSWGCPSISKKLAKPVINTVKGGTLLFAYGNNKNWLKHETYVKA